METEKYFFRVGAFFLLALVIFVYSFVVFGNDHEGQSMMRYAVYFENSVAGLTRGAAVKLKGIEVGAVDDIRFISRASDRILVTIDVADTAPVRQDTVGSIAFQGITGATYLSLENTRPEDPPVYLRKEKGEKYPVIRSEKSDLQNVLASAPDVLGKLARTADQAQKLLNDKNIAVMQGLLPEAHDALFEAAGAFREIKMLARTIREDPSIIIRGTKYTGYQVQK